jgi:hypothetical protein
MAFSGAKSKFGIVSLARIAKVLVLTITGAKLEANVEA